MIPYPLLSILPLVLGKVQSLLIVFQQNGNLNSNQFFIKSIKGGEKIMRNVLNNNKGYALAFVLIISILFTVIFFSFLDDLPIIENED